MGLRIYIIVEEYGIDTCHKYVMGAVMDEETACGRKLEKKKETTND